MRLTWSSRKAGPYLILLFVAIERLDATLSLVDRINGRAPGIWSLVHNWGWIVLLLGGLLWLRFLQRLESEGPSDPAVVRSVQRRLSDEQRRRLRAEVIEHGGQRDYPAIFFGHEAECEECRRYVEEIRKVFDECGWTTTPGTSAPLFEYSALRPGITIQRGNYYPPDGPPLFALLKKWFEEARIEADMRQDGPGGGNPFVLVGRPDVATRRVADSVAM